MNIEHEEPDSLFAQGKDRQPTWTAGQVASRLGVTESTLRSWHRRYGLEPYSARQGGQRRYNPEDLVRLTRMRELVDRGMRPSAAANLLHAAVALGDVHTAVVVAAKRLDTATCADLLTQTIHRWGVMRTWDRVCRPALTSVERDQRSDPDCVDDEHALSWSMTVALHRVHRPLRPASVMLACAPGEQHALPVEALAAALAENDVSAQVLGAAMPTPALVRAVTSTTPEAVVLWSHRRDPEHHVAASAVAALGTRLIVAGPGWRSAVGGWDQPRSLSNAVTMLCEPDTVEQ
ncbi:MerR family transcriptional regulator [Actinokineospora diospyrosa]|uniref:MerR HTH family regulatory protein n=1 Tax=Actinokineospora diospyrosa TaxID=103728 RepID=A0ABT1IJ04_9PSEU|nr:MerR family transcriptional regulator [Actinokineospora diospyrosa]MCP2272635.1 MerR HTH family regulatory protein [Actinokineospora diospyrosa]